MKFNIYSMKRKVIYLVGFLISSLFFVQCTSKKTPKMEQNTFATPNTETSLEDDVRPSNHPITSSFKAFTSGVFYYISSAGDTVNIHKENQIQTESFPYQGKTQTVTSNVDWITDSTYRLTIIKSTFSSGISIGDHINCTITEAKDGESYTVVFNMKKKNINNQSIKIIKVNS